MNEVPGILLSLGAGLLSVASPCVLPLIPGYISYISGTGAADGDRPPRRAVLARTLAFVLGFTAIFTVLGLIFGGGALLLGGAVRTITTVAGIVIVLFGLNTLFDFLKFLNAERRAHPTERPTGLGGAFLVGVAFGAGWTPCVGPILASILLFASRSGNPWTAGSLLAVYSLGLALPFLAAGIFLDRMRPFLDWFKRRGREIRIASGLMLVLLGLGMALGQIEALNGIFTRAGFALADFARIRSAEARTAALAAYAVMAALAFLVPRFRGRPFLRPGRVAFLALLAAAALGEALGWWSGIAALSGWLLFQGI